MYICGGFNVYPREIEEVLLTHPAVAEVAIVGVPSAFVAARWAPGSPPRPLLVFGVEKPSVVLFDVPQHRLTGWLG